jgi:hypothetical protein
MSDAHPDVCHPPSCSMGDFYIAIEEDREIVEHLILGSKNLISE